jgi:8-hydroxy-5-deazaflavin:NADPH oxidoreductase
MMKIGIIGTGIVGRTLGAKLLERGNDVFYGTRDPDKTLTRSERDAYGSPPFGEWKKHHPNSRLGTFQEAASHGDLVINATAGTASLEALTLAGRDNLRGKTLIDIANPLDFSQGFPPSLAMCNTDSLGEQIQKAFPETHVVKALNTMNCAVMANPELVSGDHHAFMSGNNPEAKAEVSKHLAQWFGWKPENIIDLGDISTARGTEMLLPIWLRLYGVMQGLNFNFHIAVGPKA